MEVQLKSLAPFGMLFLLTVVISFNSVSSTHSTTTEQPLNFSGWKPIVKSEALSTSEFAERLAASKQVNTTDLDAADTKRSFLLVYPPRSSATQDEPKKLAPSENIATNQRPSSGNNPIQSRYHRMMNFGRPSEPNQRTNKAQIYKRPDFPPVDNPPPLPEHVKRNRQRPAPNYTPESTSQHQVQIQLLDGYIVPSQGGGRPSEIKKRPQLATFPLNLNNVPEIRLLLPGDVHQQLNNLRQPHQQQNRPAQIYSYSQEADNRGQVSQTGFQHQVNKNAHSFESQRHPGRAEFGNNNQNDGDGYKSHANGRPQSSNINLNRDQRHTGNVFSQPDPAVFPEVVSFPGQNNPNFQDSGTNPNIHDSVKTHSESVSSGVSSPNQNSFSDPQNIAGRPSITHNVAGRPITHNIANGLSKTNNIAGGPSITHNVASNPITHNVADGPSITHNVAGRPITHNAVNAPSKAHIAGGSSITQNAASRPITHNFSNGPSKTHNAAGGPSITHNVPGRPLTHNFASGPSKTHNVASRPSLQNNGGRPSIQNVGGGLPTQNVGGRPSTQNIGGRPSTQNVGSRPTITQNVSGRPFVTPNVNNRHPTTKNVENRRPITQSIETEPPVIQDGNNRPPVGPPKSHSSTNVHNFNQNFVNQQNPNIFRHNTGNTQNEGISQQHFQRHTAFERENFRPLSNDNSDRNIQHVRNNNVPIQTHKTAPGSPFQSDNLNGNANTKPTQNNNRNIYTNGWMATNSNRGKQNNNRVLVPPERTNTYSGNSNNPNTNSQFSPGTNLNFPDSEQDSQKSGGTANNIVNSAHDNTLRQVTLDGDLSDPSQANRGRRTSAGDFNTQQDFVGDTATRPQDTTEDIYFVPPVLSQGEIQTQIEPFDDPKNRDASRRNNVGTSLTSGRGGTERIAQQKEFVTLGTGSTSGNIDTAVPFARSVQCECPARSCAPVQRSPDENLGSSIREIARSLNADSFFDFLGLSDEEIESTLASDGSYTLFIPSNEAVSRLPTNLIDHWRENNPDLTLALLNHVVRDRISLDQLKLGGRMTSRANDATIFINNYNNEAVTVNGHRIIHGDVTAPKSGIIHVIEGTLCPIADQDIINTLRTCNKYDGFLTLADVTKLLDTMQDDGPYTVFLPSNEALTKIPSDELAVLKENSTVLREFLEYHIVKGAYFSGDLKDGQYLTTLHERQPIRMGVRVDGCYRRLVETNNSPIFKSDIPTKNGVIHVVDWILRPNDLKVV